MNPLDRDQWLQSTGRKWDEKTQSIVPATTTQDEPKNEGLDANQKRVGQLGPKAKYAKKGDLVGTMESVDPLDAIKRLLGK